MKALQKLIDEARRSLFSVKGPDVFAALEEVQAKFADLEERTTALEARKEPPPGTTP